MLKVSVKKKIKFRNYSNLNSGLDGPFTRWKNVLLFPVIFNKTERRSRALLPFLVGSPLKKKSLM